MRKTALFLALVLCIGAMAPLAAGASEQIEVVYEVLDEQPERTKGKDCYEVLNNRSFEIMDSEEALNAWGFTSDKGRANTRMGGEYANRSTDAHDGEYSVRISVPEEKKYCDLIYGAAVKEGEVYEFSVWQKMLKDGKNGMVTILFQGEDKKTGKALEYGRVKMGFGSIQVSDGWVKKTVRFTAPSSVRQASVCLNFNGPGEILWDDASLLCITNEMPKPEMPDEKPAISYLTIPNAGFEEGKTDNWSLWGISKVTDEVAHSGKYSAALHTEGGSDDGCAETIVTGFVDGATYQLSAYIMTPTDTTVDMGFWLYYSSKEYYDWEDVSSQIGQEKPRWGMRANTEWTKYIAEFTPPEGTKSVMIYFRHRLTPGQVFMDDVSLYMVKAPNALNMKTDEVFYYTEYPTGTLSAEPYFMEDPANTKAEFSFVNLDGTETHTETVLGLTENIEYNFRTEWMTERGKRYHIRAKVYDKNGTLLQSEDFPVYRFDRPTYLGADGIFRKNGKEYTFTFASGARMDLLERNPEKGGLTVLQFYADDSGLSISEKMDRAYEQGILVLITLYSGRTCAGHADRIDNTIRTVTDLKDHPALFGWIVQDEPYQKGTPEEEMILAYETIRNIDPNHPVYIDDSPLGSYEWLFRYADFVDIDYYGGSSEDAASFMMDLMATVHEASKGRKPFSLMQQTFPMNGYLPSADELRHMSYQAFFSGAAGYSFHPLGLDTTDGNTTDFMDRPEWKDIVEKWAPWERDFMYGCFVTGEYKFVNYQKTDKTVWATYTDGTNLYAIVLNRLKKDGTSVEIPLTDGAAILKVGNYTATTMTGENKKATGNGTLSVSLAPWEAVVWKVTPTEEALNAAHLKISFFRDTIYYPWAYNAISVLEEKGIINRVSNNWYGPERNITRGDYAMFLVRTLGLTGSGENFADVEPDAEYAKELAIGRAAGIINGIGDNKFNPEAEITRQDMMTMTSRAMKLTGSADLSAFSDNAGIADYAKLHVSAMVAEGLIKGNADGTINPKGNTTRAEAAVIMQRIISR